MSICPKCGATSLATERFCGACGGPLQVASGATRSIVVGSAPGCDVTLDAPSVSGRHLSLSAAAAANRFVVRDLSSTNGTFLQGERITEAEVGLDDVLQLGVIRVPVRRLASALTVTSAPSGPALVVGRSEGADIIVDLSIVSSRHAELRAVGGALEVRDLGSANGTWVDDAPTTGWTRVGPASRLRFGTWRVPSSQVDAWLARASGSGGAGPTASVAQLDARPLRIGRAPDNDIVLNHASVSWHHARLEKEGAGWVIIDLGSANGTRVRGVRVPRAPVSPDDAILIGAVPLSLRANATVEPRSYVGYVRLDAVNLVRQVDAGGRVILDDVTFTVYPGELVALMGPSGAGKTTLLEVLTGQQRPTSGSVSLNGEDLHANRGRLADRIGYVPQEDVMHRDLTVFGVLYHAARLRLPGDLPDAAVRAHTEELIRRLRLENVRDRMVGGESARGISGGQRKRVNIAIELITEPPLLFLDEPTSGLDATSTLEVLEMLRELADHGTTIIMTVHQPRVEAFRQFHMLVLLAKGGKLAYFGDAEPGSARYFAARSKMRRPEGTNPADYVLDVLDPREAGAARDPDGWKRDFLESPVYKDFVAARREVDGAVQLVEDTRNRRGAAPWGRQFITLLRRIFVRKSVDTSSLLLQALQPIIVGALLAAIFHGVAWPPEAIAVPCPDPRMPCPEPLLTAPQQAAAEMHAAMFLVAATAFWLGASNVARELVAERAVFLRERMAGLSATAYVAANLMAQATVGALQSLVLVGLAWAVLPFASSPVHAFALVLLALSCGVSVGMAISASVRTEVTAVSSLPLLLLPQLMLAGYLQLYKDMDSWLQSLSYLMPVRWAFESFAQLEYAAKTDLKFSLEETIGFADADGVGVAWLLGTFAAMLLVTWLRLVAISKPGGR